MVLGSILYLQSSPIAENGDIVVFGDIAENGDIPPTLLFWGIPRGALEDIHPLRRSR